MTAGVTSTAIARPRLQLPPILLALALALSFTAGAAAGPLTSLIGSTSSVAAPVVEFDAVKFRAEERQPLGFDAVQFRCEERVSC